MTSNEPSQWLSNPRNNSVVMSAWEDFLGGGSPSSSALRRLIADSWERSLTAKVDPASQHALPPVDDDTLGKLRNQHSGLLLASRPVMAMAKDFLVETGSIMILTDPGGTILSIEGDERAHEAAASIRLIEGGTWSERMTGTNAIGTALSVGSPVQVHAAEHFCAGIKGWTCTATVIRDPYDGQIVGAVDISGLNKTFTPHSLALVATTASRIESQLAKRELNFRYQLLEQGMAKMAGTMDGIIICDRRGHPIKVNEYAKSALLAQGVTLDLSKTNSISSLTGPVTTHSTNAAHPAWLRPGWIEPVMDRGERIGTVLTIPLHRQGNTPAAPLQKQRNPQQADTQEARGFGAIKGNSSLLVQALEKAKLLAKINVPVLLLGETGVGKENFARGMHLHVQTQERPFVALNCGGLSPDLLASELFGYCEGAFTGSRRGGMTGKLEAANGGTLFLDEIGEMPLELQAHFLRVLEEGEIYRIGENAPRKIAFKLIAATNRELRDEVTEGRFRMDLYYRLSVTSIRLPPLRECRDDIGLLVAHFLEKFARQYETSTKAIDPQAIAMLERYHWPGNVRELRNIVESMFLMSRSDILGRDDLPPEIIASAASGPPGNLQSTELKAIHAALEADRGNLTMAARRLGIAKSTLYTKIKKYGMETQLTKARDTSSPEPAKYGLHRP